MNFSPGKAGNNFAADSDGSRAQTATNQQRGVAARQQKTADETRAEQGSERAELAENKAVRLTMYSHTDDDVASTREREGGVSRRETIQLERGGARLADELFQLTFGDWIIRAGHDERVATGLLAGPRWRVPAVWIPAGGRPTLQKLREFARQAR